MGLLDAIKGLFGGDGVQGLLGSDAVQNILGSEGVQGILESTGLTETVGGLVGEGGALAENFGLDLGQVTESIGLDGLTESLPGGVGDALSGLGDATAP